MTPEAKKKAGIGIAIIVGLILALIGLIAIIFCRQKQKAALRKATIESQARLPQSSPQNRIIASSVPTSSANNNTNNSNNANNSNTTGRTVKLLSNDYESSAALPTSIASNPPAMIAPVQSPIQPFNSGSMFGSSMSPLQSGFGFFSDPDPTMAPTPGQALPPDYNKPVPPEQQKYRLTTIRPLEDFACNKGAAPYEPGLDGTLVLPPRVTLGDQRKALLRDATLRPVSDGFNGFHKNRGNTVGIWNTLNPPPDLVGEYKPSGNISWDMTDSYFSAAAVPPIDYAVSPGAPNGVAINDPTDFTVRASSQINTLKNPPIFSAEGNFINNSSRFSSPFITNTPMLEPEVAAPTFMIPGAGSGNPKELVGLGDGSF